MKVLSELVLLAYLTTKASFLSDQAAALDMMLGNTKKTSVLFVTHHKSGSTLAKLLVEYLSRSIDLETTQILHVWNYGWDLHLKSYDSSSENTKIVHFVRDPMSVVVSGYNYHMLGSEQWEFFWNLKTANERRLLNCSDDFPIFIDCLRSKSMHDGLITQVLMNLYYPSRNHYVNFFPEMVSEYNSIELLPELALNVCLEEFQSDFEGTVVRICNFIGICGDIKELISAIRQKCVSGSCRIFDYIEKNYECRQRRQLGTVCPMMSNFIPLFEDRNRFECLKKCKRLQDNCKIILEIEDKCKLYKEPCEKYERSINPPNSFSVISQTCYDLPDFEVANVGDLLTSLERRPILKQQLEALSMQMRCGGVEKSLSMMSFSLSSASSVVAVSFGSFFVMSALLLCRVRKRMSRSY